MRAWDIREPQEPVEVGFYVPVSNANTTPDGYMTNNVEVDNRGIIIVCDRNGAGLDLIELRGKARDIGLGIEDRAKAEENIGQLLRDFPAQLDGAGRGHGEFDGAETAGLQRAGATE